MSLMSLNINNISFLELLISPVYFKLIIIGLAILSSLLVITSVNPILSLFNLIVLYIIIAFYLIFIGITYLGISYIVVYIGAIAILFLFIIMMIDIEVTKERSSNYLPLLLLILGGFLLTMKTILFNMGMMKINSFLYKGSEKMNYLINSNEKLININTDYIDGEKIYNNNIDKGFDTVMRYSSFENCLVPDPTSLFHPSPPGAPQGPPGGGGFKYTNIFKSQLSWDRGHGRDEYGFVIENLENDIDKDNKVSILT